uniref:Ig-like domain-containing protein n=1 Tax=Periophthalmus magnuspinnatus TaxID=409849 RepID=A0A3B4B4I5_9GOBI
TSTLLLFLKILLLYLHEDVAISACSDSDKADMTGLDGEVLYYSDFDKQEVVYTLPHNNRLQSLCLSLTCVPLSLCPPDPPGAPLLYPEDHLRPSHPNTLVCQASGFYPAPVHFSWTKDGHNVTRSASVSQAYPQSDGTFTQFSRLDMSPEEGQVYSCALEHPALKGAQRIYSPVFTCTYFSSPVVAAVEFQKPSLAPSVFRAVGLTLGLVGVAVGTFFLVKGRQCC